MACVEAGPVQQEYHLRKIKDSLGDTSLEALKKHLSKIAKDNPEQSDEEKTKFEKLIALFYRAGVQPSSISPATDGLL